MEPMRQGWQEVEGFGQSIGDKVGRHEHRLEIWTGRCRPSGQERDARYRRGPVSLSFVLVQPHIPSRMSRPMLLGNLGGTKTSTARRRDTLKIELQVPLRWGKDEESERTVDKRRKNKPKRRVQRLEQTSLGDGVKATSRGGSHRRGKEEGRQGRMKQRRGKRRNSRTKKETTRLKRRQERRRRTGHPNGDKRGPHSGEVQGCADRC